MWLRRDNFESNCLAKSNLKKALVKSLEKMDKQDAIILEDIEKNGLKEMRMLNNEFLAKNKGSEKVRDYLAKADDTLMLIYLKGRKYRPEHAWETLKRKAEVRFDEYPEVFICHPNIRYVLESGMWSTLKNRNKNGARILCFRGGKWNPSHHSFTDLTITAVQITEKLLLDRDTMDNGLVFIQDCEGMGMNHVRQYTLPVMLRVLNVFWYACPLKFKEVYFINVPYYATWVYGLIRPFLSKKLKERVAVTTASKKFEAVHAKIDPAILPKYLGGELEDAQAFEMDVLENMFF